MADSPENSTSTTPKTRATRWLVVASLPLAVICAGIWIASLPSSVVVSLGILVAVYVSPPGYDRAEYTPPQLAKMWQVSPEKIIALIRAHAFPNAWDAATPGSSRSQFRIPLEDVLAYRRRRSCAPQKASRRRQKSESGVREFIT